MGRVSITDDIKEKAHSLGYDLCGIIPADSLNEYCLHLDKRIERFPESRQLYEKLYNFGSPEKKEKWAKSIIVCVRRYNKYKIPSGTDRYFGKVYLFDGRLKCSEEYRNTVLFEEYLRDLDASFFKDFTAARLAAVKAGLGQFGKNNFLYTQYGSWVWIDTWTVNLELKYDEPAAPAGTCPENCKKCIESCPTGALSESFAMDRGTCISQLTCFSSDLQPDHLRDQMGTWLYGCDVCQDECPMNRDTWIGEEKFPELDSITELLIPEKIFEMDEKIFLEKIHPRFWYIGKNNIRLWKCNAIRAMANSHETKYHTYIKQALRETDEKVKSMAEWACKKLGI